MVPSRRSSAEITPQGGLADRIEGGPGAAGGKPGALSGQHQLVNLVLGQAEGAGRRGRNRPARWPTGGTRPSGRAGLRKSSRVSAGRMSKRIRSKCDRLMSATAKAWLSAVNCRANSGLALAAPTSRRSVHCLRAWSAELGKQRLRDAGLPPTVRDSLKSSSTASGSS